MRATKVEATEYSVFGNQRTLGLLNPAGFPVEEYSTFLVEKLVVGELSKGRRRRRKEERGGTPWADYSATRVQTADRFVNA